MSTKTPLIVITGPTASGKSDLAVRLARRFGGEIISADSRQIYRLITIGTAKIPGRWQGGAFIYKGISHHLIDIVPPKKICTVTEYQGWAEKAIREILSRGNIPILAGGTGFWIESVAYGHTYPNVPPNAGLRKRLEKMSAPTLLRMLEGLDAERAKTIEQKNPRRIIRAIEIARAIGRVPKLRKNLRYRTLWIGLNPPRATLKKRIEARARAMLAAGLIREIKKLIRTGISKKRLREFGFEYRDGLANLEKRTTREELLRDLIRHTLNYARRQMTWFRRNPDIHWIERPQDAERLVKAFLHPRPRQRPRVTRGKSSG